MNNVIKAWLDRKITKNTLAVKLGKTHEGGLLKLDGIDLRNHDLSFFDFSGCSLKKSNFQNSNLVKARFDGSMLEGSNFHGANLRKANFDNSVLDWSNFKFTNLHRSSFAFASAKFCDFSGCVDFTDIYLKCTDFEGSDFQNIDFGSVYPAGLCLMYQGSHGLFEAKNLDKVSKNSKPAILKYAKELLEENISDNYGERSEIAEQMFSNIEKSLKWLYQIYSSRDESIEVVRPAIEFLTLDLIERIKKKPTFLREINPRAFEELVCEILASFDWKVHLTAATNDGGYDIFCISKDVSGLESSWLVECKRYNIENKVGVDVVRSLYGVKSDLKVSNALIATTSTFTKGVQAFKNSRYDIQLCDFERLVSWVEAYKLNRDGAMYKDKNSILLPKYMKRET